MLIDNIRNCENIFPSIFSNRKDVDYGIFFYNEDNKCSYDSNHVILFPEKINNLNKVLKEIAEFYKDKGLLPRIYHPFQERYFSDNKEVFIENNYEIASYGVNKFMLLSKNNMLKVGNNIECKLISNWDENIEKEVFLASNEEYEINVAKKYVNKKNCYVFVGYLRTNPVAITYIHYDKENNVTRFDYILVSKRYRNLGYGAELLSSVVNFCRQEGLMNCYQWPDNPISEKLSLKAGFRYLFEAEAGEAVYNG